MKKLYFGLLVLTLMVLSSVGNAACPSPVPTCTGSGTKSLLSGKYGCLGIRADTSNVVKVSVSRVTFSVVSGTGTVSINTAANDNTSGSTTTYSDFQTGSATYCMNSDNTTGYIFPSGDCPIAFVLSDVTSGLAGRVRLVNSKEQKADTVVCRHQ